MRPEEFLGFSPVADHQEQVDRAMALLGGPDRLGKRWVVMGSVGGIALALALPLGWTCPAFTDD